MTTRTFVTAIVISKAAEAEAYSVWSLSDNVDIDELKAEALELAADRMSDTIGASTHCVLYHIDTVTIPELPSVTVEKTHEFENDGFSVV